MRIQPATANTAVPPNQIAPRKACPSCSPQSHVHTMQGMKCSQSATRKATTSGPKTAPALVGLVVSLSGHPENARTNAARVRGTAMMMAPSTTTTSAPIRVPGHSEKSGEGNGGSVLLPILKMISVNC